MSEEKTRVDFNAPESLVDRADAVAELLNVSRTQLLTDALRKKMEEVASDEAFRRQLRDAFYDGRVEFEFVEAVLGTEEAMRLQLLERSLDREPPEPRLATVPSDDAFYGERPPAWDPDEEDVASSPPQ